MNNEGNNNVFEVNSENENTNETLQQPETVTSNLQNNQMEEVLTSEVQNTPVENVNHNQLENVELSTNELQNNQIEVTNDYQSNSISDDDLINAYMGDKAEKFRKQSFSICTFFFGLIYFYYRKLNKIASYWFSLNIILNIVSSNMNNVLVSSIVSVIGLIANIVFAILFPKLYLKNAEKEVNVIKQLNSGKSNEELLEICKKNGGVWKPAIIFGIFIYVVYAGLIIYSNYDSINNIISNHNIKETEKYEKEDDVDYEEEEEVNDNYTVSNVGGLYLSMNNSFKSEPLDGTVAHYINDSYDEISIMTIDNIDFNLFSTEYIKQMNEKGFNCETLVDKNINNNIWKTSHCKYSIYNGYFYLGNKDNKIYILSIQTNNKTLIDNIEQALNYAN